MTYFGNPNGQNQRWSFWTFEVRECGRHVPRKDVEYNAARWIAAGFGRAGRVRVRPSVKGWKIECLIEGPDAHDPKYLESVQQQFEQRFVFPGWGPLAWGRVSVDWMAGSRQDGKPAAQMVEMPSIIEAN